MSFIQQRQSVGVKSFRLTAMMQRSLILLFLMGQCCFITCQLHQYHFVKDVKNWTDAQQYCREKHSYLATVSNMTDMNRIIDTNPENKVDAWIGLFNEGGVNRTWYWSLPGVEFSDEQTNWRTGEPGDGNCGVVFKQDLTWGAVPCAEKGSFLCYDEQNSSQKYILYNTTKSWQEAQSYCRDNHTDLISGLKQLQDVNNTNPDIFSNVTDSQHIFIGLFRDSWRWSDESTSSFRHWNPQSNYGEDNNVRCAMIAFIDEGRWKTDGCDQNKPFICYDDKMTTPLADEVILIKENKTWEEALDYCRVHHHDLVTITSIDEQRWVQEKAKEALTPFVWVGLCYACTLDLWFWINDKAVSYENWVSDGQMDQCDVSGAMETGGQHQWFKRNDTEKFNFICSKH